MLLFLLLLLLFWGLISHAQGLPLALNTGIIPGGGQETLWDAKDRTLINHMQDKCLFTVLSLQLLLPELWILTPILREGR